MRHNLGVLRLKCLFLVQRTPRQITALSHFRSHPESGMVQKRGTGTSPEPVFWVVVEGCLGGESPFLNHAQKALSDAIKLVNCWSVRG